MNSLSAAAKASEIASFTMTSSASQTHPPPPPVPAAPPPPPSDPPPVPPPQKVFRPRPRPLARPKMLWPILLPLPPPLLLVGERLDMASAAAAAAASSRFDRLAREEVTLSHGHHGSSRPIKSQSNAFFFFSYSPFPKTSLRHVLHTDAGELLDRHVRKDTRRVKRGRMGRVESVAIVEQTDGCAHVARPKKRRGIQPTDLSG